MAQQLPVSVTPVSSAGYIGAHRAETASRATRIRPWARRGLAIGTLTAGLWLAGSLSQASGAEATPSSSLQPHAVSSTGDASTRLGAVEGSSTAVAARHSGPTPTTPPATQVSHVAQAKTSSTGSAAAGAGSRLGTLAPTGPDTAGATPPTGSGAAHRPPTTVVNAAASTVGSLSAVVLPAVPAPRAPAPAVPALPAPALPSPAALVPAVVVPALPAAPARPVVPARPAEPARALPAAQPAAEATELRAPAATGRNHGWSSDLKSSDSEASDSASTRKPAGQHLSQQPISESEASAALPHQPSTPPAGHRPSPAPGLGLGGGGHHPLDSGLAPPDLSSLAAKPAGDCRGRDHTPPRERASAPSTSPD